MSQAQILMHVGLDRLVLTEFMDLDTNDSVVRVVLDAVAQTMALTTEALVLLLDTNRDNQLTASELACQICPANHYCSPSTKTSCAVHQQTLGAGHAHVSACKCVAGYVRTGHTPDPLAISVS